jgi:hypothetical protein
MIDGDYGDFSLTGAAFTLDAGVVDAAAIATNGVDSAEIVTGAVKSAEIYDGTIVAADIGDFGITDNKIVQMDDADAADDDYAKFTANGLEGRSAGEVADDIETSIQIGNLAGSVTDTVYMIAGWGSGRFDTVKTYNQAYWSCWTPPTTITVANVYATVESKPTTEPLNLQVLKGGVAIHTDSLRIPPDSLVSNQPTVTTTAGAWLDEYTCKILHTDSTAAGLSVFIRYMQITTINP